MLRSMGLPLATEDMSASPVTPTTTHNAQLSPAQVLAQSLSNSSGSANTVLCLPQSSGVRKRSRKQAMKMMALSMIDLQARIANLQSTLTSREVELQLMRQAISGLLNSAVARQSEHANDE